MSEFEPERDSQYNRSLVLAILMASWLTLLITAALIGDYRAQIMNEHYIIPQWLIEAFVDLCRTAIGAATVGGAVGLSIHLASRKLEKRIEETKTEITKQIEQSKP